MFQFYIAVLGPSGHRACAPAINFCSWCVCIPLPHLLTLHAQILCRTTRKQCTNQQPWYMIKRSLIQSCDSFNEYYIILALCNLIHRWTPVLHRFIRSIRVEYNTSRERYPRNLRFSNSGLSIDIFPSSTGWSIVRYHEMQPYASSGSTCATRPSVSPWSRSK